MPGSPGQRASSTLQLHPGQVHLALYPYSWLHKGWPDLPLQTQAPLNKLCQTLCSCYPLTRRREGRAGGSRSSPQVCCQDRCTEEPVRTPACCIWGSSTALLYSRFSKPAPMFLDDSFRKWARIREFVPPFGIKGQGMLGTLAHSTLISYPSACLPALRIGLCPQKSPCWRSVPPFPSFPSFLSSCFSKNKHCLLRAHHLARAGCTVVEWTVLSFSIKKFQSGRDTLRAQDSKGSDGGRGHRKRMSGTRGKSLRRQRLPRTKSPRLLHHPLFTLVSSPPSPFLPHPRANVPQCPRTVPFHCLWDLTHTIPS